LGPLLNFLADKVEEERDMRVTEHVSKRPE